MSRRLSWVAVVAATLLVLAMTPAAAVGPFGPAQVLLGGTTSCESPDGDAAVAVDGTTRGFANCTREGSARIWFVRSKPGVAPFLQATPYTGVVLAVAWDGADSTYVVFQTDSELRIGKRIDSSGAYSPLTPLALAPIGFDFDGDVVASNGRWWAVWREPMGVDRDQSALFQRHTLLGVEGRTQITSSAVNFAPTLAYAAGRMTMVWVQGVPVQPNDPAQTDLRIADSTGGAWQSRPFASLGLQNLQPDLTVYSGTTWVSWTRDGHTVVADNAGGTFYSRTFATVGVGSTVAVSGSHVFVAWHATVADRAYLAELSAGTWTGSQVAATPSHPLRVLAQGSKARVVYATGGNLDIRTQT